MVIPYDKVRLLLHPIFGKFHSAFEHNEEVFWLRKKNMTRRDVNIDQVFVSIVNKYALSHNSGMKEN